MPRSATGTSKGIAFVQFEEKETAVKALGVGQFTLGGRPVYVKTIENRREVREVQAPIPEGSTYQQQAQERTQEKEKEKAGISVEH